jgi:hypothetical protein
MTLLAREVIGFRNGDNVSFTAINLAEIGENPFDFPNKLPNNPVQRLIGQLPFPAN